MRRARGGSVVRARKTHGRRALFGRDGSVGGQVRHIDAVRRVDRFRWVSAPQGAPRGIDRSGAVYKGQGEVLVIRVGARQIKALTMPN